MRFIKELCGRTRCRKRKGIAVCARTANRTARPMMRLDGMLPQDHRPRAVRGFVESMDLSAFYERIGFRRRGAGRPAVDPAVLLALRLFATLEGVGSARRLAQLCASAMRRSSGCAAALPVSGAVSLEEIAVDGTKVRASAGWGSFRSERGLSRYEAAARGRISALKAALEVDPEAGSRRLRAARARAARELGEKVAAARKQLAALRAEKAARSLPRRRHRMSAVTHTESANNSI